MGKKINPKIFRIKTVGNWESRWFARHDYAALLEQDVKIREFLKEKLLHAFVALVEIERSAKQLNIFIHSGRPGIIIGKGGVGIEDLRKTISRKFVKNKNIKVNISIKEISRPNLSAVLVGQAVKFDIEKRIPFRRSMKQALQRVEKAGAQGVKIICGGRLNGAEIARSETQVSGKIPLHTLRADIDYAEIKAHTTYGVIGIKVWIFKGIVFKKDKKQQTADKQAAK